MRTGNYLAYVALLALAACATAEQKKSGCEDKDLGEMSGLEFGLKVRGKLDMNDPVNVQNIARLNQLQIKCGRPVTDPASISQSPKSG